MIECAVAKLLLRRKRYYVRFLIIQMARFFKV